MKIHTTQIQWEDLTLDVTYTYHPFRRGARDSFMGRRGAGPQLEPDEPASVEIEKITLHGHHQDLGALINGHLQELFENMVMEQETNRWDDYEADRAEYLMERNQDR